MDNSLIVAKNTFVQVLGRGSVVIFSILTTALLTRLLGASNYGHYVFILTLIMFFVTVADWGTGLIFVREAAKNPEKQKTLFGNAYIFRLALALISILLINLFGFFPQIVSVDSTLRIGSLILLLIILKTTSHIIFQVKLKFEIISVIDLLISVVFFLFLFSFFEVSKLPPSLNFIITLLLLANIIGTGLSLWLANKMTEINYQLDKEMLKTVFKEALPTGALLFTFSIYNRIDIFILELLKGPQPVGIYGLAYKVHDNLILGAAYLAGALFPIISRVAHNDKGSLPLIYRKTFDLLIAMAFFLVVFILFFSPQIISIIGGKEFSESVTPLRILVFATVFSYFNHLTGYTIIALGKQKVSFFIAIIAFVWNLTLNLIFIPKYSYLAASVITITTEGLIFLFTGYYLSKYHGLRPGLTVFKTLKELIKTKGKIY